MRSTRLLLIACLALNVSCHAQFGKFGDMVKKAAKKPSTAIQRGAAATREAVAVTADVTNITAGDTKELTLTIKGGGAQSFGPAEQGDCIKVSDFKAVSDTQVKMKITANPDATDGLCPVTLTSREGDTAMAEINVKHKPKPGENFKPEQVTLEQAFAQTWKLNLPGGKVETLTRGKQTSDGGYEYKDTNGKWYQAMYMGQALMLSGAYGNQCSYQGMANSKGEGLFYALSNACGVAMMAPMEATSK